MIDDPQARSQQQRELLSDQKEYLLGEAGSAQDGSSLREERKALSHVRNAAFSLNGFERNFYFEDTGGKYRHLGAVSGVDSNIDARSFAVADFDRDGDLDIVVKNLQNRLLQLFTNEIGMENQRVVFALRGTKSNRDAIGARIEIAHGARRQMAQVRSAQGFQAQSPNEVFFGLADATTIDRVEIFWPSGERETLEDVEAGYRYLVEEGAGIASREKLGEAATAAHEPEESTAPVAERDRVFVDERAAPLFSVVDAVGEELSARDTYEKGPTVLSFMTTWTLGFIEDLQALAKIRDENPDANVILFLVDLPGILTDPARVEFAKSFGFQVATCDAPFIERFTQQPNVVFPWTVVVVDSRVVLDAVTVLDEPQALDRILDVLKK